MRCPFGGMICGRYEVYENRAAGTGRKIGLNIVVLRAEELRAARFTPCFNGRREKEKAPAAEAAGALKGREAGPVSQGTVESYFWPLSTGGVPLWSCGTPTNTDPEQLPPLPSCAA